MSPGVEGVTGPDMIDGVTEPLALLVADAAGPLAVAGQVAAAGGRPRISHSGTARPTSATAAQLSGEPRGLGFTPWNRLGLSPSV